MCALQTACTHRAQQAAASSCTQVAQLCYQVPAGTVRLQSACISGDCLLPGFDDAKNDAAQLSAGCAQV
jgi:hypothetical protein